MSMELMVKAMKTKVGNPLRKLVLIKLADNANDQGECWPSFNHIADQCEISRRSVINHIDALIECGLLVKTIRKGGNKGNHSNVYHLDFSNPSAGAALPPSAGDAPPSAGDAPPPSAGDAPPSAGDAPPPSAGAAPRTSHSLEPVSEPLSDAGKPASKKTDLPDDLDFSKWPEPPSADIFKDFKKLRQAKKAPFTQSALKRMTPEIIKAVTAGYTVDQCLELCCERGWQGFRFDWMQRLESDLPINTTGGAHYATGQSGSAQQRHGADIHAAIHDPSIDWAFDD